MPTLLIATRFRGPPDSANGGYFAGTVASLAARTLTVRLLKPPPLDAPFEVRELPQGQLQILYGEVPVGRATPAELSLAVPRAPRYLEAVEASRRYAGFRFHRFPGCFVCGTQRARGDGLRIFAGAIPELALVAAPWVPDASLDRGDGKVRPEFMAAALDCPGYYAVVEEDRMMLLAEFTAHIDRPVHVGDACTVIGWKLGAEGRKHEAGTALLDGQGVVCGRARALWIEPKSTDG
ncbi:MAG: hypothetical protein JOZ03_09540 [Gammaproteobacteria bacterium]|nr:hypothetical protein [Gammaproteobacteria bacterium]